MAGAPVSELVARIIASDEASETLAKVSEQVEATAKRFVSSNKRAQEQIAAIIAKGDPAKQAKIAADKEIEQAQRIAKARPQLAAEAAAAEVAIRRRLAATLADIDKRGAVETASAAASTLSLQQRAKGAAETVSKIASFANTATTALGGMDGAAGQAASTMLASFGAGGPIAIGIAAVGAAVALTASRYSDLRDRIRESAAAASGATGEFKASAISGLEDAKARLAKMTGGAGDESAAEAGLASGGAAAARARVAQAQAQLEFEARRGDLLAERNRLNMATGGGRNVNADPADVARLGELRTLLADPAMSEEMTTVLRKQIADYSAAIPMLEEKADILRQIAEKERAAAVEGGKSRIGVATGASMTVDGPAGRSSSGGGSAADFTRGRLLSDELSMFGDDAGGSAADAAAADLAKAKRARSWFSTQNAGIWDDSAKASAEEQAANVRDTISDASAWLSAGESAMTSFLDGMRSDKVSDKLKGVASGLLTVLGGALGFAFGGGVPGMAAGAGLGSGIGSLLQKFEDGGPAFAVGRRGLATLPGGNDGIPAVLHPNEFTFSAPAVRAKGGIGAVAREHEALVAGKGYGSGGGSTTINVVALDPQSAVGVIERSVEPAMTTRLAARQGALYRAELQRAARGPRSGV